MRRTFLAAATAVLPTLPLAAQNMTDADVRNCDGTSLGTVKSTPPPSWTMRVTFELESAPERTHAIHQHETGDCSADHFTSAEGPIAGEMQHAIRVDGGPLPGDLQNVTVQDDGVQLAEFFNPHFSLDEMIFDEDGAAFIMHAGTDDDASQPACAAGDRIACAAFSEG